MTKKRMLIIGACDESELGTELINVASQVKHYSIDVILKSITNEDELKDALSNNGKFDYIYLCTHGSSTCFGDNCSLNIKWTTFANYICQSGCINRDGIFFMACCRGGLNQVAFTLFKKCPNIEFVCGPRSSLTSAEILIGFNIFLYNIEIKKNDPVVAAEKIKAATDLRFTCFDREEVETNLDYIHFEPKSEIIVANEQFQKDIPLIFPPFNHFNEVCLDCPQ